MTFDTLSYGGVEADFATWGFSLNSIKAVKSPGRDDTFTATIKTTTITAEANSPTFAFEGVVIVRSNRTGSGGYGGYSGGTVKFVGKRVDQPAKADSGGQGVTYKFKGPWYDLMNVDYMQVFQGNGATYLLPEVVLNTAFAAVTSSVWGTYDFLNISVGDQIQAILQWLLSQYAAQGIAAPFQYVGRTLHSGAIDLSAATGPGTGTPGGNYNIFGQLFNYALAGSPSIDPTLFSLFLPTYIAKPMKCAQALQKCLLLSPRINIWFDYTATSGGSPLPMIRFDLIDSGTAKSLPLFTGPKYDGTVTHKAISINPRYDLQMRAVCITYKITQSVAGVTEISYVPDKWSGNGFSMALPGASNVNLTGSGNNSTDPNCGLRVMTEILDLQGIQTTVQKGHLDLQALACIGGSQATKRAWWASKRGGELAKLEDWRARFGGNTIPDATLYYAGAGYDGLGNDSGGSAVTPDSLGRYPLSGYDLGVFAYRIVRGTYHAWMAQTSGILAVKVKAVSQMTYNEYDCTSASNSETDTNGNITQKIWQHDEHVNLELTNAVPNSGTYANFTVLASLTPGEAYIIGAGGIAQYIYGHMNVLQYEGDYVTVGAEFVDSTSSQFLTLGNKLNLTGGATAWATMNAQIQEITEDYATHTTSVKIGVAKFLEVGQLSSMLNMWRFRRPWYNPAIRTDNTQVGTGQVDMAKANAGANTTDGLKTTGASKVFDYSSLPTGSTPGTANTVAVVDPTQVTAAMGL